MKRYLAVHILCWGIVIFFPLFFYNPSEGAHAVIGHFMRSLGGPIAYMFIFYLNYLQLIPKLLFKNRKRKFGLINVGLVILGIVIMSAWWSSMAMLFPEEGRMHHGPHPIFWPMYFQFLTSLILFIGLSMAIRYSQHWSQVEDTRREAEKSRAEADLKNLRNQLNPHFLLNTLNNIYALISFDSDRAQKSVEELSKLLRHALYENQQDNVPLYKEVAFMRNYIELMKIRVTDNTTIETDFDIAPDDATPIAPLIFISLIENAFKHGISPVEHGFIKVMVAENDGNITCEIRNSNFPKRTNDKSGSGIGLEQVSKRLELMYKGHYVWDKGVSDDGKEYYSRIEIYNNDTQVRNS
jgi:two-component sensor histidine kinase